VEVVFFLRAKSFMLNVPVAGLENLLYICKKNYSPNVF